MLSHGLWQRRFGASADVIGTSLEINGRPRTVSGVMPPLFELPLDYAGDRATDPVAAASEMRVIADRWVQAGFVRSRDDGRIYRSAVPLQEFITGDLGRAPWMLLGAVGVVLLFAVLALVLAPLGTYATMSLLVAERAHEFGIRIALGAERNAILGRVLREGFALAAAGSVIGLVGAVLSSRLLENLLYEVSRLDPLTLAVVPGLLTIVTLAAAYVPARRAAAVDPVNTLRHG